MGPAKGFSDSGVVSVDWAVAEIEAVDWSEVRGMR